jgi:hypothetical protein
MMAAMSLENGGTQPVSCFMNSASFSQFVYQISSQSAIKCLTYSNAINVEMTAAATFENGAERPLYRFFNFACFS